MVERHMHNNWFTYSRVSVERLFSPEKMLENVICYTSNQDRSQSKRDKGSARQTHVTEDNIICLFLSKSTNATVAKLLVMIN